MFETSNGFQDEYRFLSNFWLSPIQAAFLGELKVFVTAEHYYQVSKISVAPVEVREVWLERLLNAETPGQTKRLGSKIPIDGVLWDSMKLSVMEKIIYEKFTQNPSLRELLVQTATQNVKLVEYNNWGDVFWGVDLKTGVGENHLGKTLMKVRGLLV